MTARSERDLLDDCVHCGFCLPACPTYRSWGVESDSPRGRIDLMKGIEDGSLALDAAVVEHFDACLGCMACVTACPSGVRYDQLIESTRAKVETQFVRSLGDRLVRALLFALLPYPKRLRAIAVPLALYASSGMRALVRRSGLRRLLPPTLAQLERLAPSVHVAELRESLPLFTPARGTRRGSVALVAGCVQRVFFPNVNAATIRVLAAEGYDVIVPRGQGCCGALSLHVGRADEARDFARRLVGRFGGLGHIDAILINAAGCGSTLKGYAEMLGDSHAREFADKVRDVNEFLAGIESVAPRRPLPLRVAYHDACHLAHAQRIREQPRALLRTIPALEVVEIPDGEQCCGSAGVYNLLEPRSAAEIGARKADNVQAVGADVLASANPGCTLQIGALLAERGRPLLAAHPIEILDAALCYRPRNSIPLDPK
ncbi:MAG: (Fe-S)-binding protein [Candidatus Eremiobacteraeota bacterium]|nr:(Fe-S)-binding protein [Candidatus Eremiobacteraeota bacterium]